MNDEALKLNPERVYAAIRDGVKDALIEVLRGACRPMETSGDVIARAVREGAREALRAPAAPKE